MDVHKGPSRSLRTTHVAYFSLDFDEDNPDDVDAISLLEIHALPLDVVGKIGGPTAIEHVQRSIDFGYMIVVMANEDISAMAIEMHYPQSTEPYTSGSKQPDKHWRVHSMCFVNGGFDDEP